MDFRCHRWDIFDDALMLTAGVPNRMTTIRTCFQTVEMRRIDVIGDGAALTGMALLRPGLRFLLRLTGFR